MPFNTILFYQYLHRENIRYMSPKLNAFLNKVMREGAQQRKPLGLFQIYW